MDLLELPIEVFRSVMEETVVTLGLRDVLRLRLVCSMHVLPDYYSIKCLGS